MARFIEFLMNHWALASAWVLLLIILISYLKSKSGKSVSTHEATLLVNRSNGVILDIRERKVFEGGHIVDAVNIPLAKLTERMTELDKSKDSPLIVVCNMGQQAGEAVQLLEAAGYSQVSRMSGGMTEWKGQGLPLVAK